MSYTSLNFMLFVGLTMAFYFCLPWKEKKWMVLLAASYLFYMLAGYRYAVFLLLTTVSTYGLALWMEAIGIRAKQTLAENKSLWDRETKKTFKAQVKRKKKRIMVLGLVLNFGILIFLKYYNMFAGSLNDVLGVFRISFSAPTLRLFLPLGISFYTFQSMGYLVDVYRETVKAQRNIGKFALFVSFFPQIIQGPIGIYDHLAEQLYEPHEFDFTRFKHACELILWGVFKKLLVADRALIAISAMEGQYDAYNGTTLTFMVLLYALQLYADFSGGIDISRGVAQIFGITMAENFRQPYFATSINDYWRRWHISLGEWFRNYLFYPLAISKGFGAAGKRIKTSKFGSTPFGEHVAKVLPTSFASFIVFFLVGVWHGPNWKYVAFGVWNGGIIMLSVLMKPIYSVWMERLKINAQSVLFRLFQMGRTFLIVLIGYVFDVAPDFPASMRTFVLAVTDQDLALGLEQISQLGLTMNQYGILTFGALVMLAADILHEKFQDRTIAQLLDQGPFLMRYAILLAGLLLVAIFGIWGPGYDPADFVYMQF